MNGVFLRYSEGGTDESLGFCLVNYLVGIMGLVTKVYTQALLRTES